jgi:hypothetical protein
VVYVIATSQVKPESFVPLKISPTVIEIISARNVEKL